MGLSLQRDGRTQLIIDYIKENTPCNASAQAINKKLDLGIKASSMYKKIKWLKDKGHICEYNGKYYHSDLLPKELEKFI